MAVMTRLRKGSKRSRTRLLRRLTQAAFELFIIVSSILHYVVTSQHMASIDAYCPFGASRRCGVGSAVASLSR